MYATQGTVPGRVQRSTWLRLRRLEIGWSPQHAGAAAITGPFPFVVALGNFDFVHVACCAPHLKPWLHGQAACSFQQCWFQRCCLMVLLELMRVTMGENPLHLCTRHGSWRHVEVIVYSVRGASLTVCTVLLSLGGLCCSERQERVRWGASQGHAGGFGLGLHSVRCHRAGCLLCRRHGGRFWHTLCVAARRYHAVPQRYAAACRFVVM